MNKKRETTLKSYIHNNKENYHLKKDKSDANLSMNNLHKSIPIEDEKDNIVKQWLSDRLKDKLQRASITSLHSRKPILLFRKNMEETDVAIEEEISYLSGNHIVHLVYAYGGFVPSAFHTIEIFTLDKFTKWIVQGEKKDLLLQCIEELEQQK
ncbi:MAG TPA: hypothetical protein VIY08_02825 [Candidatus Nitrosocosmicus sp.]